ncbi:uncharacterized protein SPPG_08475 [Spizellomyces punctatus DAOM BR117]|uniref:Leucine-rich repeat-containing protein 40 n=1 Tax=Spizellomyces punctatus (strain DAOM BR117) TaxID=645134 RepID=A0A0L0H4H6_SPIPD|nr:uncharacterized protein SPPG_08475 [Spizellomyces punctatus DAOM BR117]KNC96087.1 hypothetical protein SPPG_08475 [Spizellomyces punctatus DAOM BR117]|eukprot:XP_016604127.1 hypothetical protein SPPG_08475 [Spizellomyces punctatus DAOM BR117]
MLSSKSSRGRFKRPEFRSAPASVGPEQVLRKLVAQSRTSGRLNLSNRSLTAIPNALWDDVAESTQKVDLSFDRREATDANWWEVVDLTRLIIADNMLEDLDPRVGMLHGLTVLDIHNNVISRLPEEIGALINLSILNVSGNSLTSLPAGVFALPIIDLNLANNKFSELPASIGDFKRLKTLDVSNNKLTSLPTSLNQLTTLTTLNLSRNELDLLGDFSSLVHLSDLEVTDNRLTRLFPATESSVTLLQSLLRLDLRRNQLTSLAPAGEIIKFPALRELYVSQNTITKLGVGILAEAPHLQILDVGYNKLTEFPMEILGLKELKRLDITNNSIGKLPPELGLLEGINAFLFTGNPLRGVPLGSTSKILSTLRDKIADAPSPAIQSHASPPGSPGRRAIPPSTQEAASRTVDLSQRSLGQLDSSCFSDLSWTPSKLILHHNAFTRIPEAVYDLAHGLTTLVLNHNQITEFPVKSLPNLQILNLSSNFLTSLPSSPDFPALRELNVNHNRIASLPPRLPFPQLETFLVSANVIDRIDPNTFRNLQHLHILELADNNIAHIPPELGLCTGLRILTLGGNPFRVPRRQILDKGTDAILAYLRDRIPT